MSRPILVIDPAMQGGAVCIQNTRVPAMSVAGCVFAGDSVNEVAGDYQVTRADVLLACWYFAWASDDRKVRRRWGKWAEVAHLHFARSLHVDKLADPPGTVR